MHRLTATCTPLSMFKRHSFYLKFSNQHYPGNVLNLAFATCDYDLCFCNPVWTSLPTDYICTWIFCCWIWLVFWPCLLPADYLCCSSDLNLAQIFTLLLLFELLPLQPSCYWLWFILTIILLSAPASSHDQSANQYSAQIWSESFRHPSSVQNVSELPTFLQTNWRLSCHSSCHPCYVPQPTARNITECKISSYQLYLPLVHDNMCLQLLPPLYLWQA